MAWRIVKDVPAFRLRVGQEFENRAALRQIGRAIGKPLWEFSCPTDAGLHHSERVWPQVLEIEAQLGKPLECPPPDPAELIETEKALEEARQAQQAAGEGLSNCKGKLEEIEKGCTIIGLDNDQWTAWKLNLFHLEKWSDKLSSSAAEVGRPEQDDLPGIIP